MRFFRSTVQMFRVALMFAVGWVELAVTQPPTQEARAEWLHRFCKRAVRTIGIAIEVEGVFPERGAVISNHQGYLDIVVFAALHRCVFVSKAEIAKWPAIGWMTTMAGTVYVARGRGGSAQRARSGMQAAADAGIPVVFFPEGTTTNGEAMLPFRSGILAQAMNAGQVVTAAYMQYSLGPGNGPNVTVSDDVNNWRDEPMLRHIFLFLSLRNVNVKVRFADGPIKFTSDTLHRKKAAIEARAAVLALSPAPASDGREVTLAG